MAKKVRATKRTKKSKQVRRRQQRKTRRGGAEPSFARILHCRKTLTGASNEEFEACKRGELNEL